MRLHSVYVIPCECGQSVESHEPQATCPSCGRLLVLDNKWGHVARSRTTAEGEGNTSR